MGEITGQGPIIGPVLVLPRYSAREAQLQEKLREYKGRLNLYGAPELQMDTICKITVLEELLKDGFVDVWELCAVMAETYGDGFDAHKFDMACGVINDYCKTGGENNTGGTGLPSPK